MGIRREERERVDGGMEREEGRGRDREEEG